MDKGELTIVASRLVTGKCLSDLQEICENQKTISTIKLQSILSAMQNELIEEAIQIKKSLNK